VAGQEWGLGPCPLWDPRAKPLLGAAGLSRQILATLFVKISYFVTVLRMTAIFAFIAYKCSRRNDRKKNQFGGIKVAGQATVLVYLAQKVDGGGDCRPCPIGSTASRRNALSLGNPVVDEERMNDFPSLRSMLWVSFIALTLLQG